MDTLDKCLIGMLCIVLIITVIGMIELHKDID